MKKSKLSKSLVSSFIAAMALASCSPVSTSKNYIVTLTGYDGNTINVLSDYVYQQYKDSTSGISKFYDQILETLIRYEFESGNISKIAGTDIKSYSAIKVEAENKVKSAKKNASDNADDNDTEYSTEWNSILSSKGCETEKELLNYFIYEIEKEEIEDWYFDKKDGEGVKNQMLGEYIGVDTDGNKVESKVTSALPYHIAHILIKVDSGATDYYNGTISKAQADSLSNVVSMLSDGQDSFGYVASVTSEDGSASSYGDVGIMTDELSGGSLQMVSEFQLGIYAYDAVFGGHASNQTIEDGLGLNGIYDEENGGTDSYADIMQNEIKLTTVPYSVFKELGQVSDQTKSDDGVYLSSVSSVVYPRNILWNKYLNHHEPFVITNANVAYDNADKTLRSDDPNALAGTTYDTSLTGTRWVHYDSIDTNADSKVLCDEKGNVIIGVRSEYGIHFMVIEKSVYDYGETTKDASGNYTHVSLNDYYSMSEPGDSDWDSTYKNMDTYVNFIKTENKSDLISRATTISDKVESFDPTYDYRLYEYLNSSESGITINWKGDTGETLKSSIENYITLQQAKNIDDHETGMNKVWSKYVEMLRVEKSNRTPERMVPESCKIGFQVGVDVEAIKEMYEEGGICYYGK